MKKLTLLLFIVPYLSWGQDGVKPIIDMHLHDYTEETYYVAPSPDGTMAPGALDEYRQQVRSLQQKYNIVKAVVSTIGGENIIDNKDLLIHGYYTNTPPADTSAFKALIKTGKLKVFGEIGAVYGGYTLSDPAFEPFLKICERNNIPVAVHTVRRYFLINIIIL